MTENDEYYSDVTDKKTIELLNEYHAYDKKIRGEFLIKANWIEDFTEQIIAKLLIGEDKEKEEFIILILRKIPYDVKVTLFSQLMKKFTPEFDLEKLQIQSNFGIVKKIRNIYAHSVMDLSDKFLELNLKDTVQFEIKKDGKKELKRFTKKELKQNYSIAGDLITDLVSIDLHLHNKYKKNNDSERTKESL